MRVKGQRIIREELPDKVSAVVDKRCQDIINWSCNYGKFGTIKLDEIARSAYLQGFMDAYDALTKGRSDDDGANGTLGTCRTVGKEGIQAASGSTGEGGKA